MVISKISGIYQIQSRLKPERIYIGSSVNIRRRWNEHRYYLRKLIHVSKKLQRHYNKYGESDLEFSILESCDPNRESILNHEQFFLDALKPYFNTDRVAGSRLGSVATIETKIKLRNSHLGQRPSAETLQKRSNALKGKAAWNKGIPNLPEHKARQSKALKNRTWEDIYGVEGANHRRDISRKKRGIKKEPLSLEHKQKISKGCKEALSFLRKPIFQYDRALSFIKEWESISSASRELNISSGNICMCLTGKRPYASNYIWKYSDIKVQIING